MTLEDKIYQTLINNPDTHPVQQCEQIAEEFAIGFTEWVIYGHISLFLNSPEELLGIYKKEKGL